MGLIERIGGRRTYLDSNIFIYAFEGHPAFSESLARLLAEIEHQRVDAATSEISLAEALVMPLREGRADLVSVYEVFLQSRPSFAVVPVSRAVLVEAARLRAGTRLKLPDAIHAATARHAGCDVLLTNDTGIKAVPGLEVVRLADLVDHG
ncbi:type II toxin-antitoxin system VapC family toxin [Rubrivirga sp.]|uniref:type II toxin-antitoxin system VapC family toxin n=1 Tax=Rubrivirga sp. TaxID=1885344 RepID=UPI003B515D2F